MNNILSKNNLLNCLVNTLLENNCDILFFVECCSKKPSVTVSASSTYSNL